MSEHALQHQSEAGDLLEKEECRRLASAADGCAGGAIAPNPIERFTPRIEALRNPPDVHGPARLAHNLIVDFFIVMFRLLARLAERHRNGTLPALAPAPEPRAWPADLRPRESGWAERRDLYDPWGDSTARGPVEPPEVKEPTEALQVGAPREMPVSRKVRVRRSKTAAHSADATCDPMEASSMWLVAVAEGAALFRPTMAGFLRRDSKKPALEGGDTRVHFVTV